MNGVSGIRINSLKDTDSDCEKSLASYEQISCFTSVLQICQSGHIRNENPSVLHGFFVMTVCSRITHKTFSFDWSELKPDQSLNCLLAALIQLFKVKLILNSGWTKLTLECPMTFIRMIIYHYWFI